MPENNSTQELIDEFIGQIMAERGETALSAEEQAQVRADLQSRLEERVGEAIFGALPDDKLIELEQLMDMGAADEVIMQFFKDAGVDYSDAVNAAVERFQEENRTVGRSVVA